MLVRIGKKSVDVSRRDCGARPCFQLGLDKGSYTPGVGYSYYPDGKERRVCMTRHLHGCPSHSVCPKCRTLSVDHAGAKCDWGTCDGVTIPWPEVRSSSGEQKEGT